MSQCLEALQIANRAKTWGGAVRQEIATGVLSVAEALDDPRAGHMRIGRVLTALHQYGPTRANRVLADMDFPISPTRRVRQLTARQKALIVEALER